MTAPRDPDAILDEWLEEGPTRLPEVTRRAIAVTTRTTHQTRRPLWVPWRFHPMQGTARIALAGLAIVAIAVGGLYFLGPGSNGTGVGGVTTPTPSLAPTVAPTAASPQTPSAAPSPIDTTAWVPFTSARYGFGISHPADWTARASDHDWTFAGDATTWLSSAEEVFMAPNNAIRVGAWAVPLAPGTSFDEPGLEAWITQYCQTTKTGPCTGIHERVVPMCLEKRDCHLAMLVPFTNDVQAFFQSVDHPDQMVVVAIGWGERAPATASFGGSRRLLEAFLSTINVWPAPAPSAS